jgi:hypothetical protein
LNPDKEKRNATDLLISLEEKIITLTKVVVAADNNTKIVLNKLNELFSKQGSVSNASIAAPTIPKIIAPERPKIETANEPRPAPRPTPDVKVNNPKVIAEKNNDGVSKIPVVQKILDQAGNPAYMTEVSVREKETSEQVYTNKTNYAGKWSAYLPVGSYIVKFSKTNKETKEVNEYFEEFDIQSGMKTLALPNFTLENFTMSK